MTTETPATLREKAARHEQEAYDSFERSDTDGFLSQWASGLSAQKARLEADLLEAGGLMETTALFNLDGTVASTHQGYGQWGVYWVLNDEAAARFGKRFFSPSKAKKAQRRYDTDRDKGFTEGRIRVAGYVDFKGANATSVRAYTLPRVDAMKAGEYEVLTADSGPDRDSRTGELLDW